MFDILIEVGKVQITWIEAIAFVLALACVICNILEIHWGWPLAIISSGLYCWLFFKNKLYGDAGVQIYFVLASLWAWWLWLKPNARQPTGKTQKNFAEPAYPEGSQEFPEQRGSTKLRVRRWTAQERNIVLAGWIGLWVLLAGLLGRFTDSDVAWADAFPTAGSLIGQILLGKKILENWFIWQAVNISMVALLAYKALWLTMLLYLIFLAMAILGWRRWSRMTS
jgi:nicotinamide mononucleotide transporter